MMDKCKKERIQIATLRTGITAASGGLLWFITGWLAQHYGVDVSAPAQAGVGIVGALAAWLITKPMFSFTEECILMKEATSKRGRITQVKPDAKTQVFLPQSRVAAATAPTTARAARANHASAANPTSASLTVGKLFDKGRITVEVSRTEGTQPEVTVTARGLSASEFKGNNGNHGLRQKLENIAGISWQNPKNLGEGKRVMTGVVKSSNEAEVAAKLAETASRYSA
ncbi:MAG: hypothetical protein KGS72_17655 [Cyanobacteria bacterium REEB67]|nr:hypothetical protein [Cyanobacteria bacterium REEB67]